MNESAATRTLSEEVRQAFERLELVPGDWGALFPLPLLYAAWHDRRLTEEEKSQLQDSIPVFTALATETPPDSEDCRDTFLKHLLFEGEAREREIQQLHNAVELLCWYLAKEFDDEPSQRLFEALDAHATDGSWLSAGDWLACREHLDKRIDFYLSLAKFDPLAIEQQVAEPDCENPPMPGVSRWISFIVLPLAQLTREYQGKSRDLSETMQEELNSELHRASSTLQEMLREDEWQHIFLTLTTCKSSYAEECFTTGTQFLASGLASRSFEQRQQILEDLSSVAKQAANRKRGIFSRFKNPWYDMQSVEEMVDQLRREIRRVRREFGQTLAAQAAPKVADAADESTATTGSSNDEVQTPSVIESPVEKAATVQIVVAQAPIADVPTESVPDVKALGEPLPASETTLKDGPDIVPLSAEERAQHGCPPNLPAKPATASQPMNETAATKPIWDLQVIKPESFTTTSWEECLADVAQINSQTLSDLLAKSLLFEEHRKVDEAVSIVPPETTLPKSLWVIGDLHCDLLAMVNAWRYIQQVSSDEGTAANVVFLGDFVDRGEHGFETLQYLCRLIRDFPGQIAVLPGNHDEFTWDEAGERFIVSVDPAETIEQFNSWVLEDDAQSTDREQFAKLAADFFARRPKALFLPDGTLIAHGGFPHADLIKKIESRADLSLPACQQDYVWLRLANAHRRLPARFSRGCEFGHENFTDFCQLASEKLQIPVSRMLRGHDHVAQRYQCYEDWPNPVITFNTMCRNIGEFGVDRFPLACIVRLFPSERVEIHRLPIDSREVEKAYLSRPQNDDEETKPAATVEASP